MLRDSPVTTRDRTVERLAEGRTNNRLYSLTIITNYVLFKRVIESIQ